MKLNNEFYYQIKGAVTGTMFVPTYATLWMGCFEILAEFIQKNLNRFLDDSYTVLKSSKIRPEEFLLILNSFSNRELMGNLVKTKYDFQTF